MRVLFRLAAGPRIGFGHLMRGRALARAMAIARPEMSVRGSALACRVARRCGVRVLQGGAAAVIRRVAPDVLIVDDPSRAAAVPWVRAARARAVPVVSVHDLGEAFCGADLTIDGSIVRQRSAPAPLLCGVRYAVLPGGVDRAKGIRRSRHTVLIALGGGPRTGVALQLARALRASMPALRIRIAAGLVAGDSVAAPGIVCLGPRDGLAAEFARCSAAITGGGLSLYEAAALDTPVVAWPVVRAQERTAAAFARRGIATAILPGPGRVRRAVRAVAARLADRPATRGSRIIDGRGASRIAAAVAALVAPGGKATTMIRPARAVLFDLDDTLYPERRFALSGFRQVALIASAASGVDPSAAFGSLVRSLRTGQRATALQTLCAELGHPADSVPALVDVMRQHLPSIRLSHAVVSALEALRRDWRLGIVTNGMPEVQSRKVAALGVARLVDVVVLAGACGTGAGKPEAAPFLTAAGALGVAPAQCVFVGDDLECDIRGARAVGMRTIWMPRASRDATLGRASDEPDVVARTIADVPRVAPLLLAEVHSRCA